MNNNYDDIINLPHHVSETRPHMSIYNRAAQFSPFAALTGYGDAVKETARLTDEKICLGEIDIDILNAKLQIITEHIKEQPAVTVTYFMPDNKKSGGAYISFSGCIKKIDDYERKIIFTDNTKIPLDDITRIDGEIFRDFENNML